MSTIRKTLVVNKRKYFIRRSINALAIFFSLILVALGVCILAWILYIIVSKGMKGMSLEIFYKSTPAPNMPNGGLSNAIIGSLMLVTTSTIISAPIGILTGIYLVEYGKNSLLARSVGLINEVLLSAPSIIVGLFIYQLVVLPTGGFSGIAGSLALATLQMPIITSSTINSLQLVPNTLREASYALGTPKSRTILSITLTKASSGIITGTLLAIARIAGETSALLYTSSSSLFWSVNMKESMASLPVVIYEFALSAFRNYQELAWVAVLIVTVGVLGLNLLAQYFSKNSR